MKKYWLVFNAYLKMSFQKFIIYRGDLLVWAGVSIGWTLFSLIFYQILFLQVPTIAGWTKEQVFILVGIYMIIDTFTWSFFWRNMQMYVESIFTGTLDFQLIKPIDTQFLLSFQHIGFTNMPRMIVGFFMLGIYLKEVQPLYLFFSIVMSFFSLLVIYALWFFTSTFTFYVEKLDNIIEIVPAMRRVWSIPSDVFSGPVGALFTIIIPLALISTTPSRILLGQIKWIEILILPSFALLLFVGSRKFFHHAIKKYSSVGS